RQAHQPIAYITGEKEFMGLSFQVDKRVLIPRPETELLAEAVIAEYKEAKQPIRILDLGTGSGALAVSLAKFLPQARVTAVDISSAALEVAKSNARRLGVLDRVDFRQGDLWLALAEDEESFDVIVSNPPYISEREMAGLDRDVLDYEPHLALEAKENGLEFYRLISERLEEFLSPGGLIAFEAGWKQASEVAWLLILTDLIEKTEIRKDYAGIERVVLGWRKNEKQQINS
ncbi:MAG: peptide chain release factor N(5)-glutamine methyltransferase, partial [bacterium]